MINFIIKKINKVILLYLFSIFLITSFSCIHSMQDDFDASEFNFCSPEYPNLYVTLDLLTKHKDLYISHFILVRKDIRKNNKQEYELLGQAQLNIKKEDICELTLLDIESNYRSQGFGSLLLTACLEFSRCIEQKKMTVCAWPYQLCYFGDTSKKDFIKNYDILLNRLVSFYQNNGARLEDISKENGQKKAYLEFDLTQRA